ncbi:MAG: NFACT RNA binding domain-containing protein [Anaerovoracaceae bacterium]
MAFDGITCRAIVNELNSHLLLGKIEKVYQPEKDELVFFVHTKNGKLKVYASVSTNHAGIYLTEDNYQNPASPSSFCMLLRKHLQNGRIVAVTQKDFERIIEIDFETRDELGFNTNKKLIIEIMGKHSNIILIETSTLKILDCIKRVSIDVNRARQILPGLTYEYPPSQNKEAFDTYSGNTLLESTSPKDILENIQGISPLIAREIFESEDRLAKLNSFKMQLRDMDLTPCVYFDQDNTPLDFHVLEIDSYRELTCKKFNTVSETISYYYAHKESSNRVKQKSSDLHRTVLNLLKKLYLKKQRLLEDIQKAENADKYRLFGELLTANLHQVKSSDSKTTVLNYYDNSQVTISLNTRLTPAKNAQAYYKKYNKAKTAIVEKNIQLEETDSEVQYLESVISFIESAEKTEDIDKIKDELIECGIIRRRKQINRNTKKIKPEPYKYESSDGFTILVGRNNKDNDILTFKTANRTDIWFHTKDIPGSHTILFTQGKEPSDVAIFEAAAIAAFHSKGKESENVPVDYTQVRFVKKPSGAKPGMVIFTDNKTVYVTPKAPESIQ